MKEEKGRGNRDGLPLVIRQADRECEESVARLFDQYRQFYGQESDPSGVSQFIAERIDSLDSVILVAQFGDEFVGFTQLYPTYSSVVMRRVWILNDLFVVPGHRRQSIGQRLLDAATKYASSTGAARLVLKTQVENAGAKSLYEQTGWVRDTAFDHYTRVIDPD